MATDSVPTVSDAKRQPTTEATCDKVDGSKKYDTDSENSSKGT